MTECRILVVDSDGVHAERCRAFLEGAGFTVTLADGAATARAALHDSAHDVVVLDATINGGASEEIASRVRGGGLSLFGMSDILVGPTNRELALHTMGCIDYFEKPLQEDELLGWLRRVTGDRVADAGGEGRDAWAEQSTRVSEASREATRDAAVVSPLSLVGEVGNEAPTPVPGTLSAVDSAAPYSPPRAATPAPQAVKPIAAVARGAVVVPARLDASRVGSRGDLSSSAFAAVMGSVALTPGFSGAIAVQGPSRALDVYFESGLVVGVRSDSSDDGVGAMLVADGILREDQADAIRRNLGDAALDDVEVLIESGVVSSDDVAALATTAARRRLQHAFGFRAGAYELSGARVSRLHRVQDMPGLVELLWQGFLHASEPAWLEAELRPHASAPLVWLAQPPSREALRLTRAQRALIGSVDGATPLTEVVETVTDPHEGRSLIATLLVGGFVALAE